MTDSPDSPPAVDDMVPRAELDAASARAAALEAEMAALLDAVQADLPAKLRGLLPAELSPAGKAKWIRDARAAGLFTTVPPTDTLRPAITPRDPDLSTLPPHARIAAGYTTKR